MSILSKLSGLIRLVKDGVYARLGNVSDPINDLDAVNKRSLDAKVPYKKWVAFLEQSGTNAPTAIIHENNLEGTIVFARTGVGTYTGTLVGAFPLTKTLFFISGSGDDDAIVYSNTIDSFDIITWNNTGANSDNVLYRPIEIRVYP